MSTRGRSRTTADVDTPTLHVLGPHLSDQDLGLADGHAMEDETAGDEGTAEDEKVVFVPLSKPVGASSSAAAVADPIAKWQPKWLAEALWVEAQCRSQHLGTDAVQEDYEDMWFAIGKVPEETSTPMEDSDDDEYICLPNFLKKVLGEIARRSMIDFTGQHRGLEWQSRLAQLAEEAGVGRRQRADPEVQKRKLLVSLQQLVSAAVAAADESVAEQHDATMKAASSSTDRCDDGIKGFHYTT